MKYVVRFFTVSIVLALLMCRTPAVAQPPVNPPVSATTTPASLPDPKFDATFVAANKLIADTMLDKAFDEFIKVKDDNIASNPTLAADAMMRAALMGYNLLSNAESKDFVTLSPEAKEARRGKETDIAKKSHDLLKQIKDDPKLADTPEGKYVVEPHWINLETRLEADLKSAIESQIDHRNSSQMSYQFVDKLVHLTGAIPAFSYWFALIIIALVVKTITFPLTLKTYKSQREMQRIQPMMKALQDKYKGKPELNEKMMAFYKEHKVNPFASCMPMLVQLPFMYFVYNTIRLYEYHFSHGTFLWIGTGFSHQYSQYLATDLSKFDIPLLTLYALSNYLTMKLNPSPDPAQAQTQKTMSLVTTVMFFYMFMKYQWSAAFIFYWLILNFVSAFQQYNYIYKPNKQNAISGAGTIIPATDTASGSGRTVNTTVSEARPLTPVPGGTAARPRPKARKRK